MIYVILGTKAQLVKMAPVMLELKRRGEPWRFVHTGQHQATMQEMLDEFGLPAPHVILHDGSDVVSLPQMALWMGRILMRCARSRREVFGDDGGCVLVHGDTFSTLLGALMGRVARLPVAHVESGLRSFHWFNPFPEELTRLATFRLSQLLLCPGAWAAGNVASLGREVVDTGVNTLADTLRLAIPAATRSDHLPDEPFAIVSLHRYENIFRRSRFEMLIDVVEEFAEKWRVLFILHPPTARKLDRYGFRARLEANPRIELRPRYTYFDVIALLQRAAFIATDGGSIQEESSYLGTPCLLLRESTERREGLGANVILSHYDRNVIRDFSNDPERFRSAASMPERSPSVIVVDAAIDAAARFGGSSR